VPVVAPLLTDGRSLLHHAGFRLALFPSQGGRWPELGQAAERRTVGRFLGRIHMVGASRSFSERPALGSDRLGRTSRDWLLASGWIPAHLEAAYETVTEALLNAVADCYVRAGEPRELRIHGDCHRGNILWTDQGPHFVDLDDCVTGPAIQDLWMLLSGEEDDMRIQLTEILEGYETFADLDRRELWLVEALRTLRIIRYAAWIARRWADPAFPRAFPWFEETRYWEDHVLTLREQAALLQEPPLSL
jgi:Ser/Thr protein kinase RdoA (MazF antagonist)